MVRRVTAPLPPSGERLRTRGSVCLTTWRRSVTPGPPLPPRREAWRIHNRRTRMGRERAAEAGTGRPPAVARATPWPVGAGPGTGVEADPRPFSLSPFRRHPRRRRGGRKAILQISGSPWQGRAWGNCSTEFRIEVVETGVEARARLSAERRRRTPGRTRQRRGRPLENSVETGLPRWT